MKITKSMTRYCSYVLSFQYRNFLLPSTWSEEGSIKKAHLTGTLLYFQSSQIWYCFNIILLDVIHIAVHEWVIDNFLMDYLLKQLIHQQPMCIDIIFVSLELFFLFFFLDIIWKPLRPSSLEKSSCKLIREG